MVGAYLFKSNKAARKHTAQEGRCVAHMFVMHVAEELPTWPEGAERKRVWVSCLSPFIILPIALNYQHWNLTHRNAGGV